LGSMLVAASLAAAEAERKPASSEMTKRIFSVSANGATAENVVRMIGQKAGVAVQIEGDLSKRVTYSFADTTLENALQQMATDVGFEYSIHDGLLQVTKASSGGVRQHGNQAVQLVQLKYMDAEEMGQKLKSFLAEGETVHVDKKLNSLVLVGSGGSIERARQFVSLFDRMPQQILIEAKIVETNDNFTREIGFLAGDLGSDPLSSSAKATGFSSPSRSSDPVAFGMKYKLGVAAGRNLDLRLLAAESKGNAKVISRPKVVTINNTRALINSGLTFSVKTLSTVQTGSSTSGTSTPNGTVAGGLERVEAGLQLGVLPSVVDTNMVRLVVDVNNSQPDSQLSIDGIPSINTNSANTSVIVEDGATAVIAGLIRNTDSHARSGVPFLSDIPVLGLLFRNDGKVEKNNEMIILITPRIINSPVDAPKGERKTASKDI
jgi:type IV pilus assembly protein PilQ